MDQLTSRQREILDYIRRHRDQEGFPPSVREIGLEFGLAPATVHDHLKALERKGRLERQPRRSRSLSPVASRGPHLRQRSPAGGVPLVGQVAAGAPILAHENIEEVLELPEAWTRPDTFLLRVRGDSMRDAHILDGDLVLVRPQKTASNGEIVVALIEDGATVKRFRKTANAIELHAENPDYPPISLRDGDGVHAQLIGKVIGVFRPPGLFRR